MHKCMNTPTLRQNFSFFQVLGLQSAGNYVNITHTTRQKEMNPMKKFRVIASLLILVTLMTMTACGKKEKQVDGNALMQVILEQVQFDTPIADVGESASYYFSDLPSGASVKMYTGSGYFADRVALITLADAKDADQAKKSVDTHVEQLHHQFLNYIPEELGKIENAVIWQQGEYILLCVTNDHATAREITKNAYEKTQNVKVTKGTAPVQTTMPTKPTTEPITAPTEPEIVDFPELTSKSGKYRRVKLNYIVDDMAYEDYLYNDAVANNYTQLVNRISQDLAGKVNVCVMPIPTAMGVVMPDDIVEKIGDDFSPQDAAIAQIFGKLSGDVTKINCWNNLMAHRTEYLYFKTDYHWNGKAAYYAYESWCKSLGYTPYTLEQRELTEFGNFWGGMYSACNKDKALRADTVEAYHPVSENIDMMITDKDGNTFPWKVISDVSKSKPGVKYSTFGGADNPFTVYKNPNVTDGSVGVVVKESFGNALMPYLVDHYSVLYEIDYRYWNGNIAQFCLDVGAKELTLTNNLGMIRSAVLVAMLADNV